MNLVEQLRRDEGERLFPYKDSVGLLTIGVGRCIERIGITREESDLLLANDIKRVTQELNTRLPWSMALDAPRRGVLLNMAFNLGIDGLVGFKNTLAHVQAGRWDDAAAGMLASLWAQQVGSRATRLAEQMRTGRWV